MQAALKMQEDWMSNKQQILLVDDEPNVLSSLQRLFRKMDCDITLASDGEQAIQCLQEKPFDVVLSDIRMPNVDGVELLSHIAEHYPDTQRIAMTGYADMEATINSINLGKISHYVEKPWDDQQLVQLVKNALELVDLQHHNLHLQQVIKKQNDQLKQANEQLQQKVEERTEALQSANQSLEHSNKKLFNSYRQSIEMFVSLLEQRLDGSSKKSIKLHSFVDQIATTIGYEEEQLSTLHFACRLKDIGKISMSDKLINTAMDQLSDKDKQQYTQYPLIGSSMLAALPPLQHAADCIGKHREYLDGSGFPQGLSGDAINTPARILTAANDFLSFQENDSAGKFLSPEQAVAKLEENAQRYDPRVIDAIHYLLDADSEFTSPPERQISTKKLLPGHVLSRNLNSAKGHLLLTKEYVLDQAMIDKLIELEISLHETFQLYISTESCSQ